MAVSSIQIVQRNEKECHQDWPVIHALQVFMNFMIAKAGKRYSFSGCYNHKTKCGQKMNLYHFSLKPFPVETLLVGMKAIHKKQQRVGQQRLDEDFEEIRKSQFPTAPSLFTSLWTTNIFDLSIPRKAFEENPDTPFGYFYQVEPQGEFYEVEPYWEVLACRAVTQSGMDGMRLQNYINEMAVKFWTPILYSKAVRDFLCPQGAIIKTLVREVKAEEVFLAE
jgi:hypothetical protein